MFMAEEQYDSARHALRDTRAQLGKLKKEPPEQTESIQKLDDAITKVDTDLEEKVPTLEQRLDERAESWTRTVRSRLLACFLVAGAALLVAGCSRSGPESHAVRSCALVVALQIGLQQPVEVVSWSETADGQVEIRYQGFEGGNLPETGRASCTFAVGERDALELVGAIIDGRVVDADGIRAANRALGPL
jgi:hypothetical protein